MFVRFLPVFYYSAVCVKDVLVSTVLLEFQCGSDLFGLNINLRPNL